MILKSAQITKNKKAKKKKKYKCVDVYSSSIYLNTTRYKGGLPFVIIKSVKNIVK